MLRFVYLFGALLAGCGAPAKVPTDGATGDGAEGGGGPAADSVDPDSPEGKCIALASVKPNKLADEPARITVKHLVVKHIASVRAPEGVTRKRGEACLRAQEALDKLKGGAEFDALVGEYSDEDGAATRAGSIGEVSREGLDEAFADAAFALDVNAVSNVVESKFGFHVILRSD